MNISQPQQQPQDPQATPTQQEQIPDTSLHPGDQPMEWAPPEAKHHLKAMVGAMRGKIRDLHAQRFANAMMVEAHRKQQLQKVFENLASKGVNLDDRKSVSDYINKLRMLNPKAAKAFETGMSILLDDSHEKLLSQPPQAGEIHKQMKTDQTHAPLP